MHLVGLRVLRFVLKRVWPIRFIYSIRSGRSVSSDYKDERYHDTIAGPHLALLQVGVCPEFLPWYGLLDRRSKEWLVIRGLD